MMYRASALRTCNVLHTQQAFTMRYMLLAYGLIFYNKHSQIRLKMYIIFEVDQIRQSFKTYRSRKSESSCCVCWWWKLQHTQS